MLQGLGIDTREINVYLKRKIVELGIKTRLDEDCLPDEDDVRRYEYRVQ